jgi:hypothetical protein
MSDRIQWTGSNADEIRAFAPDDACEATNHVCVRISRGRWGRRLAVPVGWWVVRDGDAFRLEEGDIDE